MFKQVKLPSHIPGQLYLHAMPGRHEHIDKFIKEIHKLNVEAVVCLTNDDEIRYKSPDYYSMRLRKQHSFEMINFPIEDYSVPADGEKEDYKTLIAELSEKLESGKNILIHCKMGIGRTGTVVICILQRLGIPLTEAIGLAEKARSSPMVEEQRRLVKWYSSEISQERGGSKIS